MAKTAIIKTVITTTGDGINDNYGDTPLASAAAAYKEETFTLASGDNTLTPPSGATYLYISLGTTTLKLVGVAAGTGWNIGLGKSAMVPLGGGTYVMNSSAIGTVDLKYR